MVTLFLVLEKVLYLNSLNDDCNLAQKIASFLARSLAMLARYLANVATPK
jgi:hypothetical protein